MPTVIPVKFEYAVHDLWFDPAGTGAQAGDHVICSTERGTEIGLATMDAFEAPVEELDGRELKPLLRVATDEDLEHAEELADKGDEAFPTFRRLVEESGLDMKPVGVEYLFGGEKAVCYFSAEERVDFRQLVRDLSHELHERIDMRQIGVREEAAIVGGFAHCGQELCCARFGRQFEPVSIRMAKEQDLPLNSTKISGACGRLMCCLRYEFDAYRDFHNRAPKKNAVIDTPLGKAKIVEYDTPKEQLNLRLENGKQIRVPLAEMEASEAACKKSEELGCPMRPDTVTRATLERLNSPEVQMALAELDREMGVLPPDNFDASDIFVDTSRKRRRRSDEGEAGEAGSGEGGRRQRKGSKREDKPAGDEGQKQGSRRRRRRGGSGNGNGNGGSGSDAPKAERSEAAEDTRTPRKRTRRPGDRGGEAARAQQQEQASGAQQGSEGSGPKRRRHRRGRGKGGDGQQGASQE